MKWLYEYLSHAEQKKKYLSHAEKENQIIAQNNLGLDGVVARLDASNTNCSTNDEEENGGDEDRELRS